MPFSNSWSSSRAKANWARRCFASGNESASFASNCSTSSRGSADEDSRVPTRSSRSNNARRRSRTAITIPWAHLRWSFNRLFSMRARYRQHSSSVVLLSREGAIHPMRPPLQPRKRKERFMKRTSPVIVASSMKQSFSNCPALPSRPNFNPSTSNISAKRAPTFRHVRRRTFLRPQRR